MEKSNAITLGEATSLDELVGKFESEDWGDLWEKSPEVDFDVKLKSRDYNFALDRTLAVDLIRSAHAHGVSAETLLNLWIQQKLLEEKMDLALKTQPASVTEAVPV